MKKFLLITTIVVATAASLFAYSGGSGTEADPYQIKTLADLVQLSDSTGDWDKYFIQIADINAAMTDIMNISGDDTLGFSPIGTASATAFEGSYNGQGYTIDSLFINLPSTNYIGLFGYSRGGKISYIIVTNIDIRGRDYVGGIIGNTYGSSKTSFCFSSGKITGRDYVGGLIGSNYYSTVNNSYSIANVIGSKKVGGLVGANFNGAKVGNCYCVGNVSGNSSVGGFIGKADGTNVFNCYSIGFVSNGDSDIGGFIGKNGSSTVTNCFWDSISSGQTTSAGGYKKTTEELKNAATFTDITSSGLNEAWDFIGKLNDDTKNDDYWGLSSTNNGYPILLWTSAKDSLLTLISSDYLTDVTATSAIAYGNIAHLGSSQPTSHGFCWNTSDNPDTSDYKTDEGATRITGSFSSDITDLATGVTYYTRAFAINEFGISYGRTIAFVAGGTVVYTDSISNITDSSAIGYGNITSLGATNPISYGFCWNTSGNPDTSDYRKDEGAADSTGAFTSNMINLISGRVYHAKSYAINDVGVIYGKEIAFISHNRMLSGEGTENNPYRIETLGDLYWLTQNSNEWDKSYIQTSHINASYTKDWDEGKGFFPIGTGTDHFKGKYNGQQYAIDSLYINRPGENHLGLFGNIQYAKIDSLGVINVNISGYSQIGALVGGSYFSSIITACYTSGNVTASDYHYIGGLSGRNYNSTINSCYSVCNVKGVNSVGGLTGDSYQGIINNSYTAGRVEGNMAGGLVGNLSKGTITNCYSRSAVLSSNVYSGGLVGLDYNNLGILINCFWDSTASGKNTSAGGGAPKATDEMKNYYTFTDTLFSSGLDSAWDFIANANDDFSNEDIWDMDQSGSGYPILSWQKEADGILNTPPVISGLVDSLSFANDSTVFLDVWAIAEDEDMADSLLSYTFTTSSDSILTEFDSKTGMLTLSTVGAYYGMVKLIIEAADYAESVKDSLILVISDIPSGIADKTIPIEFSLKQNYPNPFNPSTTIRFSLPEKNDVKLIIYNVIGKQIKSVEMNNEQAGYHKYVWNGRNSSGNLVSSGIYFYKINAGQKSAIKKMIFMK